MHWRILPLLLLVAGCTGPAPDVPTPPEDGPGATVLSRLDLTDCVLWHGEVDAPASTFPAGSGQQPVAGSEPGTVLYVADGAQCVEGFELWEGHAIQSGGVLVASVLTSNDGRAENYTRLGLPAEAADMARGYTSQTPVYNADGPSRRDGSHNLFVYAVSAGQGASRTTTYHTNATTFLWQGEGGTNPQTGVAEVGTNSVVEAEAWRGPGWRIAAATLTIQVGDK